MDTREEQRKPSAADVALAAKIAEQSAEIAKHWREISEITTHIKDVFYSFGLESVKNQLLSVLNVLERWTGKAQTTDRPEFGPNAPHMTGPERLRRDRQRRREADPLFVPTSFGGAANDNSSGGRAQAIIKGGVYEALIDFYGFLRGGGTGGGGGGGGIQKASLTTGNVAADAHVGDSFRRAGGKVTGDGGPIPSDADMDAKDKKWLEKGKVSPPAETSGDTVSGAQAASTPAGKNPDGSDIPGPVSAVGGGDPAAFITHHTGGHGTIEGLQQTLRQRGLGVEYAMDREAQRHVETGGPGSAHISCRPVLPRKAVPGFSRG